MNEPNRVYLIRDPAEHVIQGVISLLNSDEKDFIDISTSFVEKVDERDVNVDSPPLLLIPVEDDVEYVADITHLGARSRIRLRNARQVNIPEKHLPEPGNIHVSYEDVSEYISGEDTGSESKDEAIDPHDHPQQIEDSEEQSTPDGSSDVREDSLEELKEEAKDDSREDVKITQSSQNTIEYSRSEKVKRYVKKRAEGVCEGCGSPAPFESVSGDPYLHAHHIEELSSGGADAPDSVIALCPNCHYRVHHGKDGEQYNQLLSKKLEQLESD